MTREEVPDSATHGGRGGPERRVRPATGMVLAVLVKRQDSVSTPTGTTEQNEVRDVSPAGLHIFSGAVTPIRSRPFASTVLVAAQSARRLARRSSSSTSTRCTV